MKRKTKKIFWRWLASVGIVLSIYLIVVFLIPFKRTSVYWISFGFTILALIVVGVSGYLTFIRRTDAKSKFYGFPIFKIALVYGAVQLVLGLIAMILGNLIPVKLILIVYFIILGLVTIGLIATESVKDQIQNQDDNLQMNVSLMRSIQSKVNQMVSLSDNSEINTAIHKLAEEIRFSDPVSNKALENIEYEIEANIDELQLAIIDEDYNSVKKLCTKVSIILSERNRLCKLYK